MILGFGYWMWTVNRERLGGGVSGGLSGRYEGYSLLSVIFESQIPSPPAMPSD